jgi:hypothetical protein
VSAHFSESVTGFDATDVAVGNGVISGFSGAGDTYAFTVTPGHDGDVTIDVATGSAADASSNDNVAATRLVLAYDSTPPRITFYAAPSSPSIDAAPSIAFGADEAATTTCSVDRGPFAACTSPDALQGLAVGSHTFAVRATDAAGNVAEKSITWTIQLPELSLTEHPDDLSDDTARFAWKSSDASVKFTCGLDGGVPTACAAPYTAMGLADGSHVFTINAVAAGGLQRSVDYRWSSQRRIPRPSALIVPKISPTDMLGRPKDFRTSSDAPHSTGPFTRKLDVKLHVPTPDDVSRVLISNYPDFRDVQEFTPASDDLYDWTLLAGPSGDRPVYIRFDEAVDAPVGVADIILDQELPVLKPKPVQPKRTRAQQIADWTSTKAAAPWCGGASRRWLSLPGADGFSGLNGVQIARDPNHPCNWRPYISTFSYRLRGRTVYLRVEDRVGNVSDWYVFRVPPAARLRAR